MTAMMPRSGMAESTANSRASIDDSEYDAPRHQS
jgi:hypothetical protein